MPLLVNLLAVDSVVWALAQNAALLVALAYVHSLFPATKAGPRLSLFARQAGLGLILSLIGITVIAAAFPFADGVVFDTRSVLISLTGLYFGALPTVVVMLLTGAFRFWQGGDAAIIGVTVIVTSGLVGLAWRHLGKPDLAHMHWSRLLAFGFAVHLVMLGVFALFHERMPEGTLALVTIPVLGIYPVVTAILGKLLSTPLQRAAEARRLQDSEERLGLILKGANDGWWDWDLAHDKITYSPRWWRMLGLEPGERPATTSLWHDLLHPDDAPRVDALFKAAIDDGRENYEVEFRLRHRDGHHVSVLSRGHIQHDAHGRAVRASGTNVDISALRQALDQANTAKAFLESAGRIGRIGYWEITFADSRLFWSDITAEIHDLPPGTQIPLADALRFYPPEYHATIERDRINLVEHGLPFESEYEIITAKGRRIWTQARGEPVRDAAGQITGMRGVFQDIDAQRRDAEALLQSERNYRQIFNATTDAIFIHDETSGRIVDVNDAMLAMYGFPDKAAALAVTIADLSAGEPGYTEDDARAHIRTALAGATHTFTWHARRSDGATFWTEVVLRRTEIGGENRLLASVRDISKRMALEERLRETDKMESLGRLAGGIAHDFNNMLGVIIGHTDLANLRLASAQDARDDLAQIRTAAKRSAELVRQLLTFARRQTIAPRVIDLNQTIDATLAMLRRLIGESITLDWRPAPGLWPVKIDPVQIDQILTNLTINARDAIADTGTITIRTRNDPGADHVVLEVADTGAGMDADTLKRIFEPFFTTKQIGKGTGLGLASVHGIVEQNHGRIDAESQPGQGTVFRIRLPRQTAVSPPLSAGTASPLPSPRGTETILLVEDEPAILQLAAVVLEMQGYTVRSAPGPDQALEFARQADRPLHLLISDLMMPGMNGHALRAEILRQRPGLKTLFVSGYSGDTLPKGALADPTVAFLGKPFTPDALARQVRALLDR